jgi:hypothetical protein
MPATSLGAPLATVEQLGENIFFGNAADAPANHSYYLLFNDLSNSWIEFVFSSMYFLCNPSTHSISGLAAGDAWEQLKVRLKMTIH